MAYICALKCFALISNVKTDMLKRSHKCIKKVYLYFFTRILKFMFSKKATKIDKIFTVSLTLCSKFQIDGEDFVNYCGLLGKYEL